MNEMMWIARRVVPVVARGLVARVFFAWHAPWFVARSTLAIMRGAERVRGWPGRLRAASGDSIRCGRCGLEQPLLGRWRCPICKATETTHAFAACTICGNSMPCGYVVCTTPGCGEAIRNPLIGGLL